MEEIQIALQQYQGWQSYALFYSIVASCGMGAPINSDSVLIAASVLASIGFYDLKFLLPLAWLALLTGDSVTFFLGRLSGKRLSDKKWFQKILPEHRLQKARILFGEKGPGFLFAVRFLPLIRTALYFTAGTLQISPVRFYTLNGLSTLVYLPLLMGSSFYMAENIDSVLAILKKFQFGLLACVGAGVIWLLLRKRQQTTSKT